MAKLLSELNTLSFDVFVNAILASIAVAGFITSLFFSIKTNKNLNQQIKLQSHPILKLREVEEKKPKRVLEIKNIGTGPAFNVKYVAGIIEEGTDLMSIEPLDPVSLNSIGVHEQELVEFEEQYDLRSVLLRYVKERTEKEHSLYSLVYYEDLFGERYVSEAKVTLKFDNVLAFNAAPPRKLTNKELKTLAKEMSKEESRNKKHEKVRKDLNNLVNKAKKIAGGRK